MRTPPPVLPSRDDTPERERSWLQRQGADGGIALRILGQLVLIFVISLVFGLGGAKLRGISGIAAFAFAFVMATVLTAGAGLFILKSSNALGAGALAIVMPSGRSAPYEDQYSFQEAMAARGDVAGALASYEAIILEHPSVPAPRLRAAELLARGSRDPQRAAELFRSVRDMPGATRGDALYASNRLVDLYDGPLDDPGRAIVELRRIIERFPGTPAAMHARAALPALKVRLRAMSADD